MFLPDLILLKENLSGLEHLENSAFPMQYLFCSYVFRHSFQYPLHP